MVTYGLSIENKKLIAEKARTKKDGCYSFRGVVYRVKDTKVTHYAWRGEVFLNNGWSNIFLCTYEDGMGGQQRAMKILQNITK